MLLHRALDRLIAALAEDEPALREARARWDRETGVVHDDEHLWEERAAAFLEWFGLDLHCDHPASALARLVERLPDEDPLRPALVALRATHRSLFALRVVDGEFVELEDLWGGGRFIVRERRRIAGLTPGDLIDARIAPDVELPPELAFGRTFCVHPREAASAIRKLVTRAREDGGEREATLHKLLRLRVKCERYRHVSPVRVYASAE